MHFKATTPVFISSVPCPLHLTPFVNTCPAHFRPTCRKQRPHGSPIAPRCTNVDDESSSSIPPPPPPLPVSEQSSTNATARKLTRRRRKGKKTTAFETTVDNMTMKRMGRGTIYYGERSVAEEGAPVLISGNEEEVEELKPDAVLVIGGTGQTGLWITLGLLNQGFNIRVLSRSFSRAETLFGPSGSNVDVFEGDLSKSNDVREAVDGCVAIVYAASPQPSWFPPASNTIDVQGIKNALAAAEQSSTQIRRFVLVSADGVSSIAKSKRRAEELVQNAPIPYTIVRVAPLSDAEGGLQTIDMQPVVTRDSTGAQSSSRRSLSRVDAAQCVCQAMVQHRRLEKMASENPDAGFDFPNCTFTVSNTEEPYVPNKSFWMDAFNRISDSFQPLDQDGAPEQ